MNNERIAIILFNIGGPDKKESIEKFLSNFFSDKAILNLPFFLRYPLAKFISKIRKNKTSQIYEQIGGSSPILKETLEQAKALEKNLKNKNYKVFVSMRYWHPMAAQVMKEVIKFSPDKIILLPLYPQFSTTTTQSSIDDWVDTAKKFDFKRKTEVICCYYNHKQFISAYSDLTYKTYLAVKKFGKPRILFSAHGLPRSIIKSGDPYQWQVEQTTAAIVKNINEKDLDYVICYQSKVGPLKWITPYTEDEIISAAKNQIPIVLVPLAFVSEHSETLVELDIEYKNLALKYGVKNYFRVPTVRIHPEFIKCLTNLCMDKISGKTINSSCNIKCVKCYLRNEKT